MPTTPSHEDLAGRLPASFTFGAATSSYQIEGATNEDGRGRSIWDTFAQVPGKVIGEQNGDVAVDHYHRFERDIEIMADLGLKAYRFSIAWPRIVPDGDGDVEPRGLDFYRRLCTSLRAAGITPMATLYHWDLPQPLQDRGGWASREIVPAFTKYAQIVHGELGDLVDSWMTINEPWCAAFLGYGNGVHAPGITDPRAALRAAHHLLLGHGEAITAMRAAAPEHKFGLVPNLYGVVPQDPEKPEDLKAADTIDALQNRLWLDATLKGKYPEEITRLQRRFGADDAVLDGDMEVISVPQDLLGVNYYSQHHVRGVRDPRPATDPARAGMEHVESAPRPTPQTAMGWSIEPHGLTNVLRRLKDEWPVPPIYITENGAAFEDEARDGVVVDTDRRDFIASHVSAVADAMDDGVDVRGYFAWSLLDNYEWAFGYEKRFGIVHVDYATQARTIKASGAWYRDLIAAHDNHHQS